MGGIWNALLHCNSTVQSKHIVIPGHTIPTPCHSAITMTQRYHNDTTQLNTTQRNATQRSAAQRNAAQRNAMQCNAMLCHMPCPPPPSTSPHLLIRHRYHPKYLTSSSSDSFGPFIAFHFIVIAIAIAITTWHG